MSFDFQLGKTYATYDLLEKDIQQYEKENLVVLAKRDSRGIVKAQERYKKQLNPLLVYSEIKYICHHSGTYRDRGKTGERPKTSTSKISCPFMLQLRVSADGQHLELKKYNKEHNHEVSEEEFVSHHRKGCDSCLNWSHLKCISLKKAPKKKLWFFVIIVNEYVIIVIPYYFICILYVYLSVNKFFFKCDFFSL